jgi:IS5 family transposase
LQKNKNVSTLAKINAAYTTTDASVHDSQALDSLLDEKDEGQNLWADSAYTGKDQEEIISN